MRPEKFGLHGRLSAVRVEGPALRVELRPDLAHMAFQAQPKTTPSSTSEKWAIFVLPAFGGDGGGCQKLALKLYIRPYPSCLRCPRTMYGKNLNYFVDSEGELRAEMWP